MNKRGVKQKIVAIFFEKIPLSFLLKLSKVDIIYPYYHAVSDNELFHLKYLYKYKNIKQFISDLDCLLTEFTPISIHDLKDYINKNEKLPKKAFLLTFDDGFKEMYDIVAPILLEKSVPATFFINSDFLDNKNLCYQHKASILVEQIKKNDHNRKSLKKVREILEDNKIAVTEIESNILSITYFQKNILDDIARILGVDFKDYLNKQLPYLTSGQVKELIKYGFTIGAHSIDHPFYSTLPLEEQLFQTYKSIEVIKSKFSLNYGLFAFPHGDTKLSSNFFIDIYRSGLIDISFGTGGIVNDVFPQNIQRINFEDSLMPAKEILSYQFIRTIYYNIFGMNIIKREKY